MCDLTLKSILPAAAKFSTVLAENIEKLNALKADTSAQQDVVRNIASTLNNAYKTEQKLASAVAEAKAIADYQKAADAYCEKVVTTMQELRTYCDALETLVPKDMWPFPTYSDLLLYV